MIAGPNQHFDHETLQRLLDEELPLDEADRVECHLSDCSKCRSEIAEIAGQRQWWTETVDVLSTSTINAREQRNSDVLSSNRSSDASMDWIHPLLELSSDSARGLGRIDQYEVLEVIGQGGMGVVLRGIDPELNRPVAIKVLSPHLAGVGAARTRFMREAQSAAMVVHPSIVPIYSVVTSARLPYIVMPCINGGNLQQRIEREGPLELGEVLRIGVQIAEGLIAAHQHGVIHRDIKPANILIEEGNGRVLISDFGLARALDDATLTVSGMIAGTPQYMSPEQARGDMTDARSDLFSLGSLLYALATGRPPFRAESPLAVLRKISESKPKPIHQVNELVPQWFDTLVAKLMAIERTERIASADAAATLLREAHAHVRNPAANTLPLALTSPGLQKTAMIVAMCLAISLAASMLVLAWPWLRSMQNSSTAESGAAVTLGQEPEESSVAPISSLAPELGWDHMIVNGELAALRRTLTELEQAMTIPPATAADPFRPVLPDTREDR